MTTLSSFYDAKTGRLLQLRDLEPLRLPNPMDPNYEEESRNYKEVRVFIIVVDGWVKVDDGEDVWWEEEEVRDDYKEEVWEWVLRDKGKHN